MQAGDIHTGMTFTNDGKGMIPVYDKLNPIPIWYIKPGELIGKVVDVLEGVGGTVYKFVSDDIISHLPFAERMEFYTISAIPGVYVGGIIDFSDLAANISDQQFQNVQQGEANAEANGSSLGNEVSKITTPVIKSAGKVSEEVIKAAGGAVKEAVKQASESVNEAAGGLKWVLGAAAVGYVLVNWNKFFKAR